MFNFIPVHDDNIFAIRASGRLSHDDYQQFLPMLQSIIKPGQKISLLIELDDFHGIELTAIKDEIKLLLNYEDAFEKVAIVGDKKWQKWMALFSEPFVQSEVEYFDRRALNSAWDWLRDKKASDSELADLPVNNYKKIIAAIDFSPCSVHAARRAINLSKQINATLQLVNVVNEAALYDLYYEPGGAGMMMLELSIKAMGLIDNTLVSIEEKANKRMDTLLEKLDLERQQGVVLTGRPATTLISYAEAQHIDLIVLGTNGRRGLDAVLGSTTRYVQSHARCEVLSTPLTQYS